MWFLDSRLLDWVAIQKSVCFLTVMPVPDQVRDDGSGIQKRKNVKLYWIPASAGMTKQLYFWNCQL